jgi:hypothetical protein
MKRLLWALLLSSAVIPSAGFAHGLYGRHEPKHAWVYGQRGQQPHRYSHEYARLRSHHYRPPHYFFRHEYHRHPHAGNWHGCRHEGHGRGR